MTIAIRDTSYFQYTFRNSFFLLHFFNEIDKLRGEAEKPTRMFEGHFLILWRNQKQNCCKIPFALGGEKGKETLITVGSNGKEASPTLRGLFDIAYARIAAPHSLEAGDLDTNLSIADLPLIEKYLPGLVVDTCKYLLEAPADLEKNTNNLFLLSMYRRLVRELARQHNFDESVVWIDRYRSYFDGRTDYVPEDIEHDTTLSEAVKELALTDTMMLLEMQRKFEEAITLWSDYYQKRCAKSLGVQKTPVQRDGTRLCNIAGWIKLADLYQKKNDASGAKSYYLLVKGALSQRLYSKLETEKYRGIFKKYQEQCASALKSIERSKKTRP